MRGIRGGEGMFQRGLAILLSTCMLAGGVGDTAYAKSPQTGARNFAVMQNVSQAEEFPGELSDARTEERLIEDDEGAGDTGEDNESPVGAGEAGGDSESPDGTADFGGEGESADEAEDKEGDSQSIGGTEDTSEGDKGTDGDSSQGNETEDDAGETEICDGTGSAEEETEDGAGIADDEIPGQEEGEESASAIPEQNYACTADFDADVSELTVTKNSEEIYTLRSDRYWLNMRLTPSYTSVGIALELLQAEGNLIGGEDTSGGTKRPVYDICLQYSYTKPYGLTGRDSETKKLSANNQYRSEFESHGIDGGGQLLVESVQIRDQDGKILARLCEGGQAIDAYTMVLEGLGVISEVIPDDASITVKAELKDGCNGRIRYRRKDESEWNYYPKEISYSEPKPVTFAAEPNTAYVIELLEASLGMTVFDTADIMTRPFAASDIETAIVNVSASEVYVNITVGKYTGDKKYLWGRVSYIDAKGKLRTVEKSVESGASDRTISLNVQGLESGTEYKDLEVELDDSDALYMEYAAWKKKVSFTTPYSMLKAEQIDAGAVAATGEDGSQAVVSIALKGVTEGRYPYSILWRVAGRQDWDKVIEVNGSLQFESGYRAERTLTSLLDGTEYEVAVNVDGIVKTFTFQTKAATMGVNVSVEPLMDGVRVKAALTGKSASSGNFSISVYSHDKVHNNWWKAYLSEKDGKGSSLPLSADGQETSAVFIGTSLRPNAVNDWKIEVRDDSKPDINGIDSKVVWEKYYSLQAVRQNFKLELVEAGQYEARIKATLTQKDESIRESNCVAYLQCRKKDAKQWSVDRSYCSYGETGQGGKLSCLEDNTEYEVRMAKEDYPEDVLAEMTFWTLEDFRYVSVSVSHCQYRSAQINTYFKIKESGSGRLQFIYVYYREKGDSDWRLWQEYRETEAKVKTGILENLSPGVTYEILAELKNTDEPQPGKNVFRKTETEFTTACIDHILEVEGETEETAAVLRLQLKKPTDTQGKRAMVEVTLTPEDGGSAQSRTVYLYPDSQYRASLKIEGLLPDTRYAAAANLSESENNVWIFLKEYTLEDVVTKPAAVPDALTVSEQKIVLNLGKKKKLTATAQSGETVNGLHWMSSNTTVATVDQNGTVAARGAGEADIIVSVGEAAEQITAVTHVTVRDYGICIRTGSEDGSVKYETVPDVLSRKQERTLTLYNRTTGQEVEGVTWTSSDPGVARISDNGLLEMLRHGQFHVEANTTDGITHETNTIKVVNDIQGFSITGPEDVSGFYPAIRTGEGVYQVAAGEAYRVRCVVSPAYTDQNNRSIAIAGDRFTWTSDSEKDLTWCFRNSDGYDFIEIGIPEDVSGPVKVTAVMQDEAYKDKSFTITLDVLKKPEIRTLPATYTWLDYSNKLADAGLPENWKWKEKDTLLYETGRKVFTAYYAETGYYPYETNVAVYIAKAGNNLLAAEGDYSAGKKAYIVKKEKPLQVSVNNFTENIPALLYELYALTPAAKDSGKVSVMPAGESEPDGNGGYCVTASAKGTYTLSIAVSLKKAAFVKQTASGGNGKAGYVLTAGEEVRQVGASLKVIAVDSAPVKEILFTLAKDSPEQPDKIVTGKNGALETETIEAIEYEITAANAAAKQKERVVHLTVTAKDVDGNIVENPNITYSTNDGAVVKCKKGGTDRLILTVPKGADGLGGIVATAKDELGYKVQLPVRVNDYTPRVTAYAVTVNENFKRDTVTELAEIVLPYDEEKSDQIEQIALVESDSSAGADAVPGLRVSACRISGSHKYGVQLNVEDKNKLKKKGSLKYYLAVTSKAYGGPVFVPVKIKMETKMPGVTVKQTKKVNVFYTDTMHLASYDAVSMGLLQISSTAGISSIDWIPGDGEADSSAANMEFHIGDYPFETQWKNGTCQKKYMIRQHKPVLNGNKKPSDDTVKGTLYIHLSGYAENMVIKKPLKIQTEYRKPKIKVADYRICSALGETSDQQHIYTNAVKGSEYMVQGNPSVWKGYSDLRCADDEAGVQMTASGTKVKIVYRGARDKKTQFTLYSDYWREPLKVPVRIRVSKSEGKLSPAAVTLNTAYPMETTQTAAEVKLYNKATGRTVTASKISIEGTNTRAQELLDRNLLNIIYWNPGLSVSVNYAKAMGCEQIRPGAYKYRLTPYYGDTQLKSVVLTVKIIRKEAAVRVKTKGNIDLLKLNREGTGYTTGVNSGITVTPKFQNFNSSYHVADAELQGAYKDLFRIIMHTDGTQTIVPRDIGKLQAGKKYALSVKYTIRDTGEMADETIMITSPSFIVKPRQSAPKVTLSTNRLTLHASAKGEDNAAILNLYVPHDNDKQGYYSIQDASGALDVNKDGKTDLIVKTIDTKVAGGQASVKVYVLDADAVRATVRGTAYKIPITVQCVGRDGVSRDASTTVSVIVKK